MNAHPCQLEMIKNRLHACMPDREDPVPARIVYLRPLTGCGEVVLLDDQGEELLTLPNLDGLAEPCRQIAKEALKQRYHLPKIDRIRQLQLRFGTMYWRVDTDLGTRHFAVREPGRNLTWLGDQRLVVRDTMGNRFEIVDVAALDADSTRLLSTVL